MQLRCSSRQVPPATVYVNGVSDRHDRPLDRRSSSTPTEELSRYADTNEHVSRFGWRGCRALLDLVSSLHTNEPSVFVHVERVHTFRTCRQSSRVSSKFGTDAGCNRRSFAISLITRRTALDISWLISVPRRVRSNFNPDRVRNFVTVPLLFHWRKHRWVFVAMFYARGPRTDVYRALFIKCNKYHIKH